MAGFSPLKALAFIAVQQAVFSLYLGISFAPNHKGMPLIDSATAAGFARRQVVTARNIRGGRFTTFMLGGLNYQIEHHLFASRCPGPTCHGSRAWSGTSAQRPISATAKKASPGHSADHPAP